MPVPLQITLKSIPHSDALEEAIHAKAAKLERYRSQITHCHVTIESPHRHGTKGSLYHVHIDVCTPGGELVVSRDPGRNHAHENVYVALRDAFNAVRRQLETHVERRRPRSQPPQAIAY